MGRLTPVAMLIVCGAAWGLTLPLIRMAVLSGHRPFGILVWQQVVMAAVCLALVLALGRRPPRLARHPGLFVGVSIFGAVLPGYFSYLTAADIPAGVRSILIAVAPMCVLVMAIGLGFERPEARRAAGVLVGAAAIVLITLPGAGLTPMIGIGVILLALIAPLSYGVEANFLAWRGADGLHPFQLLFGASVVGIALSWPMAVATGQSVDLARAWGVAEWAIVAAGVLNAVAYAGYVWLVGRAGSVFASQIAYPVTGFGVIWSKLLLGETYSAWIWVAFALMLAGVALVQPRPAVARAP